MSATVRMFGALHGLRKERGQEPVATVFIPEAGMTAREIARDLELPLEKIEAVFVNHRAHGLDGIVRKGDRVAFVPQGIPSPERVVLGIRRG